MDDFRQYFEQRTDEMLDLLRQLVEIESPSTNKSATDLISKFIVGVSRSFGAQVKVFTQEHRGDHVLARWGEGKGGFLILSHLDTVWPVGTLADRPWKIEGDKVFGPGCYDNKSGAVIVLSALKALWTHGELPDRPVTVIFNSDEEVGSRSSRGIIEEQSKRADVVFCIEAAALDNSLVVWRKGSGRYVVTALGQAAHAGMDHEKGINAIEELARQVVRLQEMTNYSVGTTVNVGGIMGGIRPNIVADFSQARVDVRVQTLAEGERMHNVMLGLQPIMEGTHILVEGGPLRPPMEESAVTLEPMKRAQEIAAELGITLTASGTGGASDGNFSAALGVPTLDGLGGMGDGAHSEEEYVWIPSLPERAALMANLITHW